MRYPNLVFDLYGTLVDIRTEEDSPALWRQLALFYGYHGASYAPRELQEAFRTAMEAQNAAAGQGYEGWPDMPVEPVLAALLRQKGVRRDTRALAAQAAQVLRIASTRHLRLYPGARLALNKLRQAGLRLFLLSNAQAAFTVPELRLLGLEDAFDAVYLSSDHRCRKPDGRFFSALLRQQGLDPAACLMIGNDPDTDIAGARAVGMATLYLHTGLSPQNAAPPQADHTWNGADWRKLYPWLLRIADGTEESAR